MLLETLLTLCGATVALAKCKCTPSDSCWPSPSTWDALNSTVDGKLIRNEPLAKLCYPGSDYDSEGCQDVSSNWGDPTFIGDHPIGYSYPLTVSCPPVNSTVAAYPTCDLGVAPAYSINATGASDVAAGIAFANENNLRLVIKNTGHDLGGRSQGHGSLMIWIRHIQNGVQFNETYVPSDGRPSNWTGSSLTVGGGYVWGQVYDVAAKHNAIAVGGADPTVGVIGGYLQGAGHGRATHDYGLATDQVLEMTVVLASGEVVTASASQNQDLFTALRGGGGGTYGVVISATIKAHPTHPMLVHTLNVAPVNGTVAKLFDIAGEILAKYPHLSDAGLSGLGLVVPGSYLGGSKEPVAVYTHTFGKAISSTNDTAAIRETKGIVDQNLISVLAHYNGTFLVQSTWKTYDTFQEYLNAVGRPAQTGVAGAFMASRFFDKTSLIDNEKRLGEMTRAVLSDPNGKVDLSHTVFQLCLIGGGKVLEQAPFTSVNPGWRRTYFLGEVVQVPPTDASFNEKQKIRQDVGTRKVDAMTELTPGMGTYLNEANRDDPNWKENFFGNNYEWLHSMKQKYDPDNVFWCHHCVGSEGWAEKPEGQGYGALCQVP